MKIGDESSDLKDGHVIVYVLLQEDTIVVLYLTIQG
jgi:hypothetical protein